MNCSCCGSICSLHIHWIANLRSAFLSAFQIAAIPEMHARPDSSAAVQVPVGSGRVLVQDLSARVLSEKLNSICNNPSYIPLQVGTDRLLSAAPNSASFSVRQDIFPGLFSFWCGSTPAIQFSANMFLRDMEPFSRTRDRFHPGNIPRCRCSL